MLSAALKDPFTTTKKVYAEGARVSEIPLPRPVSHFVDEEKKATIHLPGVRRARRRMFRRLNHCAVPGYAPLCMDSNDPDTVACAFKQRLLRDVPPIAGPRFARFKKFVKDFLKRNVPVVTEMEFSDWLKGTTYNEERKKQLIAAHEALRGGRPTRKQCSHVDTFVKSEFYPTWKHARMINSRSDAFKVWAGPKIKAIEEAVYELPEFIKHTAVPLRPAKVRALKSAGRHYYQTDFTAFESHFTPEVMEACECALFRHCLRNDVDVDFLCSVDTGLNRMRTRTGISAKVRGRRMSGDMWTSLGNGFTNLMLAKFLVHEKHGILEGFVEGDDGLFSTNVELTTEDYASLGFTIKIEEVLDPCEASFCGMIFSDSGEIIRDPRRFIMGFGWTQSFLNAGPVIMDELLRAKALSSVYETPQCPIVGAFARYALQQTAGVHPRLVDDGFHFIPSDEVDIPAFEPKIDTRELFANMYGVTIQSQLAIERAVERGDFRLVATLLPPTAEQSDYSSKYVTTT